MLPRTILPAASYVECLTPASIVEPESVSATSLGIQLGDIIVQSVICTGYAISRKIRPVSAGLKGLQPKPPKVILPTPIATTAPISTIHHGIPTGRLKANNIPVTIAERSPMVVRRPIIRPKRNSNNTQPATATPVTSNTLQPITYVDTARAGTSAKITSSIIRRVFSPPWMWGEGAAKSLVAIYIYSIFYYFLLFAAARARTIVDTVCLPMRM